jgi:hypothetical protein
MNSDNMRDHRPSQMNPQQTLPDLKPSNSVGAAKRDAADDIMHRYPNTLQDLAAGRRKDFSADSIIAEGRELLPDNSPSI